MRQRTGILAGVFGLLVLAAFGSPAHAALVVDAGEHQLAPNTAGQQVNIAITGGSGFYGWEPRIQLGDGVTGPVITSIGTKSQTVFSYAADYQVVQSGDHYVVGQAGFGYIQVFTASGPPLLVLTLDTTGVTSGRYALNLFFPSTPAVTTTLRDIDWDPLSGVTYNSGSIVIGDNPLIAWYGDGGDTNWSTDTNWDGYLAPESGDDLLFFGSMSLNNVNDLPATNVYHGLTFGASSFGFNLSGNSLSFDATASIINYSTTAQTIGNALVQDNPLTIDADAGDLTFSGAVTLNTGSSLTVTGDNDTSFSGAITGVGSLTKTGAGVLTLTGANTYSGGTTVTAGSLVGNTSSLKGNIVNNAALAFNQETAGAYAGVISGSGALYKAGAGTLTLSGANTLTGMTTVTAGTLNLTGSTRGSLMLNSGTTLTGAGTVGNGDDLLDVNGATVSVGNSIGTMNVNGDVDFNAASILAMEVQAGTTNSDLLNVSGAAFFADGATFSISQFGGGTFAQSTYYTLVTAAGGFGATDVDNLVIDSSIADYRTALSISGNDLLLRVYQGITWTGDGANDNWSTAANWDNDPTGVGLDVDGEVLIFDGTGVTATADAGTYTNIGGVEFTAGAGAFTLDGNELQFNSGTQIVNNSTLTQTIQNDLTIASGQLTLNADAGDLDIQGGVAVADANGLATDGANDTTISGVISGAGGVVHNGAGMLTLSNDNTYTGDTTVNAGTLNLTGTVAGDANLAGGTLLLGNDNAIAGGNTLTIAGGSLASDDDARTVDADLAVNSGLTLTGDHDLQLTGDADLGAGTRTVTVDAGRQLDLAGVVSNGGLTKQGDGTLLLSNDNTYTGDTTVNAGTLNLAGSVDGDVALAGGTLGLFNDNAIDAAHTLNITSGTIQSDNDARTLANDVNVNGNFTAAGNELALTGDVNLGGGARTVTVDNTQTTISGAITNGGLVKDGAGDLELTGMNTYAGGTTVSAGTLTGNTDSLQGDITDNAQVIFDQAADGEYADVISGTGTLVKQGAGILTLSGDNTLTGETTVDAGTLHLEGSLAGDLTLNSGTALTGTGTVGDGDDLLDVNGATVCAGNSIGTITVDGDVNFDGLSVLFAELDATLSTADLLDATGSIFFDNGATIAVSQFDAGDFTEGQIFTIAQAAGGFGATDLDQLVLDSSIVGVTFNFQFAAGGTQLQLLTTLGLTWTGATDNNWAVGTNWENDDAPVAGDNLIFTGAGNAPTNNNYAANTNFGTIIFDETSGSNVIGGNDLVIDDNGVIRNNAETTEQEFAIGVGSTGDLTLDANKGDLKFSGGVVINDGGTLNVTGANDTTINSVISEAGGTGSLVKNGAGTLALTADNTYTGDTTVNNGALNISGSIDGDAIVNGGTLGLFNDNAIDAAHSLTVNGGALASNDDARNVANDVTVNGGFSVTGANDLELSGGVDLGGGTRQIAVAAGNVLTLSGVVDNGGLTQTGDGTLELTNDNTYTGDTTVDAGAVNLSGSVDGDVVVNGGTLGLFNDNAIATGQMLNVNGGTLLSDDDARTIANGVNVGGDFTVDASNDLTLTGDVDLTGDTRSVTVNPSFLTLSGVISNGGLTKDGAGTLVLSGTNTFTGPLTVSAGQVNLNNGAAVADTAAVNVASGATVLLNDDETIGSLSGVAGALVDLNGHGMSLGGNNLNTTYAGVIDGGATDGVGKDGTGVFTLAGDNTYGGETTVNAGTLYLTGSVDGDVRVNGGVLTFGNNDAIAAGKQLLIFGGALASDDPARTIANSVDVFGDFGVTGANPLALTGDVDLNGATRTVTADGVVLTLAGVVSNGGLTQSGDGGLLLSNDNTYTGDSTVNAGLLYITGSVDGDAVVNGGTLGLGADDAIDAGHGLFVNGGLLASDDDARNVANAVVVGGDFGVSNNSNLELSGDMDLGAATRTVTVSNTLTTFSGALFNGGLTKTGAGTLLLSGTNDFNDDVTVDAGVLQVTGGSAIDNDVAVRVSNGATFELVGSDESVGILAGVAGSMVELNAQQLSLVGDGFDEAFLGVISGAGGSLVKGGDSMFTLGGDNTYTGDTTVTEGLLYLTGSIDGDAVVNDGLLVFGNDNAIDAAHILTMNGGSIASDAAGRTIANDVLANSDFTVSGDVASDSLELAGVLSGSGKLIKEGASSLLLSGTNTRTADTDITAGTLAVTGGDALSDTHLVDLNAAGATFSVQADETIGALQGVVDSVVNFDGSVLTFGDATDRAVASNLTGTGGFIKQGSGVVTLSGDASYTGDTTVNAGALTLQGGNAIGDTSDVTLADAAGVLVTLEADETIGSLAGGGTTGGDVQLADNTLTIGDGTHVANATFDGDILSDPTGRLVLNIANGGSQTFTGTINAGGGFDVDHGTVNFAPSAVIVADVTNDGALAINNTITGNVTNLASGTFYNNGVITGDVDNFGFFGGNGTVNGVFVNRSGANLAPGNSIGTVNVNGAFTLAGGSTLTVEVNGTKSGGVEQSDLVAVTGAPGTATLEAGSNIQIVPITSDGNLHRDDTFTIITATGGVDTPGGLESINILEDFPAYEFTLFSPDPNTLQLILSLIDFVEPVTLAGGNSNQLAVAQALTDLVQTDAPQGEMYLDALEGVLDIGGQPLLDAMDQVGPGALGATFPISIENAKLVNSSVAQYLSSLRGGMPMTASSRSSALPTGPMFATIADDPAMFAMALDADKKTKDNVPFGSPEAGKKTPWGVFAQGIGVFQNRDSTSQQVGYSANAGGVIAGVDYQMDHFVFGLSTSYLWTNASLDNNRGSMDIGTLRVGPYFSYSPMPWFVDASLTYGFHQFDTTREMQTLNSSSDGSFNGHDVLAYVRTGWTFEVDKFRITPEASLQYLFLYQEGFTESGPYGLTVDSRDSNSLRSRIGVNANYRFEHGPIVVVPEAFVGWEHEFLANDQSITSTLPGGPSSFNIDLGSYGEDALDVSAGVSMLLNRRLSFFVWYQGSFASGSTVNGVTGGLSWRF